MEIRAITIPFSKNKAKQLHPKERDIQNRPLVLDRIISNSHNTDCIKNKMNEYNNLKDIKKKIDLIYQKKGKVASYVPNVNGLNEVKSRPHLHLAIM